MTLDRPEAHCFKPSQQREQGQGSGNVRQPRYKPIPLIGQWRLIDAIQAPQDSSKHWAGRLLFE